MKYGYARVSTDGQSVDAQVRQLTKAGCKKVFREVATGAKTDRAQLRRLLDQLDAGEMTVFPKGKHDDQVDSTAQFLDWFKRPFLGQGFFENCAPSTGESAAKTG